LILASPDHRRINAWESPSADTARNRIAQQPECALFDL